jgi:hypothetical protein
LFLAAMSFNAAAQDICYKLYGAGDEQALFSWTTDAQGRIIIGIHPAYDGETPGQTAFRGDGWNNERMAELTVNGDANVGNKYFIRTINADKTQITLTPNSNGTPVPDGATIIQNATTEYKTSLNTNAWPTLRFEYTYGNVCTPPPALSTPVISVGAGNVIDIAANDHPAGTTYNLYVYFGTMLLSAQANFVSGTVPAYAIPGTYDLRVRAISSSAETNLNSDLSAPVAWTLAGDLPDLPASAYCSSLQNPTGGGTAADPAAPDDRDAAYFTWATDPDTKAITVTLGAYNGNNPSFREPLDIAAGLFIGTTTTANGADYFTSAVVNGEAVLTPKPDISIPWGVAIRYTGIVAYKTMDDLAPYNNLWPTMTFNYVYGSNCTGVERIYLDKVTGLAIDAANALTFTPGENNEGNATYTVLVFSGQTAVFTQTGFVNGSVIGNGAFALPGDYTVAVRAIANKDTYLNSTLSDAVDWSIANTLDPNIPLSGYCDFEINPTGQGSAIANAAGGITVDDDEVAWTWTTDAQGVVTIKITPAITTSRPLQTGVAFRAGNMAAAGFKVAGSPIDAMFTKAANNAAGTVTLTPNPGVVIPFGAPITYSGQVEYLVTATAGGELNNLYPTITFPQPYIYGSNCTNTLTILSAPANSAIDAANRLTFDEVTGAAGYRVFVFDATGAEVYNAPITSGAIINFGTPGAYMVKVQAIGNGTTTLNSPLSEEVDWAIIAQLATPTGLDIDYNELWFNEVPGALSYTVTVYDSDDALMHTQTDFVSGAVIAYNVYGTYTVKVQAVGDGQYVLDSELSDPITWNYQEMTPCNLLDEVELLHDSLLDTDTSDGDVFYATTWDWIPSTNYTSSISDNKVFSIHLGDATVAQWQSQFTVRFSKPVYLVGGESYTVSLTVKTTKNTPVRTKIFDGNNDVFLADITQDINSAAGVKIKKRNLIAPAQLVKISKILFDFAPNAANTDIEISDISVCGLRGSGLEEVKTEPVSVYPVPVQDVLYIKGVHASTEVKIADITGKVVINEWSKGDINVSKLAVGMYILQVEGKTIKFVKK